MLHELAALAAGFAAVVTYNGNGFDLPLLRTRGILARRRDLLAGLASLDLLPVARRLWGRRLEDCRQGTVERAIGYAERDGRDIPGHLIPQAWFDFVRDGIGGPLSQVLEHNRWDVEGMAALLGAAVARTALLDGPPTALPWQDAWSLARLAERNGRRAAEVAWIRAALGGAPAGRAAGRAPLLRRRGAPAQARPRLGAGRRAARGERARPGGDPLVPSRIRDPVRASAEGSAARPGPRPFPRGPPAHGAPGGATAALRRRVGSPMMWSASTGRRRWPR